MFLRCLFIRIGLLYCCLWGDYIKILFLLEILSLLLIMLTILIIKVDYFSLNYFLRIIIFLVCESRIGFLLFIYYIRIESDVVKKINMIQL